MVNGSERNRHHKVHYSCPDVATRITHLNALFTTDSCRTTALLFYEK